MTARVVLVAGDDRSDNIAAALGKLDDLVNLKQRECVLIKPNLVSTRNQLASTHPQALRPVLEFVRDRYGGKLLIAEGSALRKTAEGFRRFGYHALAEEFKAELVDLNSDQTIKVQVYDRWLRPMTLRLARTVVESDYRISITSPKTHDMVIVTLSLKNMIMGSLVNPTLSKSWFLFQSYLYRAYHIFSKIVERLPLPPAVSSHLPKIERSDKFSMHQGFPVLNLNLAMLAPWVLPHLSVIDGYQAMEGPGPTRGHAVDWRIALAGTDPVAVDSQTAHLMGFHPEEIGYLVYCSRLGCGVSDLAEINLDTNVPVEQAARIFKPHPTLYQQRAWRQEGIEDRLQPANRKMDEEDLIRP